MINVKNHQIPATERGNRIFYEVISCCNSHQIEFLLPIRVETAL